MKPVSAAVYGRLPDAQLWRGSKNLYYLDPPDFRDWPIDLEAPTSERTVPTHIAAMQWCFIGDTYVRVWCEAD